MYQTLVIRDPPTVTKMHGTPYAVCEIPPLAFGKSNILGEVERANTRPLFTYRSNRRKTAIFYKLTY